MSEGKVVVQVDIDLEDLIPGFLENRQKDLQDLEQALEKQDFEMLRSIGHNIKGVGGGYGFHEMTVIGAAIEESAKENKLEIANENVRKLSHYLSNIEIIYEEG
jgi:HPt (histidine-containing phosphotransfer) domain-containing protein